MSELVTCAVALAPGCMGRVPVLAGHLGGAVARYAIGHGRDGATGVAVWVVGGRGWRLPWIFGAL